MFSSLIARVLLGCSILLATRVAHGQAPERLDPAGAPTTLDDLGVFPAASTNFDEFPVGTTLADLTVEGMTFSGTDVDASVQDSSALTFHGEGGSPVGLSGN